MGSTAQRNRAVRRAVERVLERVWFIDTDKDTRPKRVRLPLLEWVVAAEQRTDVCEHQPPSRDQRAKPTALYEQFALVKRATDPKCAV